jgi:hypothetical protein
MNTEQMPFAELLVDLYEERVQRDEANRAATASTHLLGRTTNTSGEPSRRRRRRRTLFNPILHATVDVEQLQSHQGYSALQIANGLHVYHVSAEGKSSRTTSKPSSSLDTTTTTAATAATTATPSEAKEKKKKKKKNNKSQQKKREPAQLPKDALGYYVEAEAEEDEECCVCLTSLLDAPGPTLMYVAKLSCNHVFHYVCLGEWLRRSRNCPICRSRVTLH